MYVLQHVLKISIVRNVSRAKRLNEQSAGSMVPDVEVHRVRSAEFLHEGADASGIFFLQEQVKVIRHQAISSNFHERVWPRHVHDFSNGRRQHVAAVAFLSRVCDVQKLEKPFVIVCNFESFSAVYPSGIAVIPFSNTEFCASSHASDPSTKMARRRLDMGYLSLWQDGILTQ